MIDLRWKRVNAGRSDTRIIRHRLNRSRGIGVHGHDFSEFFWIASGECTHIVNDKVIMLKAGDLVFVRPNDRHGIRTDSEDVIEMVNVAFPDWVVNDLIRRYSDIDAVWNPAFPMPRIYSMTELQRQWLEAAVNNLINYRDSRIELDRLLINLVCEIREMENDLFRGCPDWLLKACRLLRNPHYFSQGSGIIAKLAGRTPEHTARTLLKSTGMTPSEVVNHFRLDYAAAQLCTTGKSITEIADECGFGSLSYFSQRFRERFKVSPRRYRLEQLRTVPAESEKNNQKTVVRVWDERGCHNL